MRAVHIITGLGDGGAEAALYRLATNCRSYSHSVVSLMDEGKYGPLLRKAGIEVYCLNMPEGRITAWGLWHLYRLIQQYNPSVVQTWMYHADLLGGIIARLAGIKNVSWGIHHSTLDPAESKKSTILVAKLCARISYLVPRVIVCCANNALEIHKELGYNRDKLVVVNNGYDLSAFYPDTVQRAAVRLELGLSDSMPVIGSVARFDPQKDHVGLLKALKVVKDRGYDFTCCLVGRGVDAKCAALTVEIERLGLQQHIVLMGQRSDISAVMNAFDIHILSSSFGEAFPNVLCEAMASGVPCVSTDVGDSGLIVGETGWVVPPRAPEELARAIIQALNEMGEREKWRTRQLATHQRVVDHFNIQKMVDGFVQAWSTAK